MWKIDWLCRSFLRCKKRRTTNKLIAAELMRNSLQLNSCGTLGIMFHARSIGITKVAYAFKKLKKTAVVQKFEDADIISMPTSATCKVKFILFMWNREPALFVFRRIETLIFVVKATLIIITSMPMFATYRAKVEYSILFVEVVNRYFESQQFFLGGASSEVLTAVLWESRARKRCTCQSGRIFLFTLP